MDKFKVGDRVKCIDASYSGRNLTLGDVYTIMEFSEKPEFIVVLECPYSHHRCERFILDVKSVRRKKLKNIYG